MSRNQRNNSRGQALANRLQTALRGAERLPRPGARELPLLRGIKKNGTYTLPMANVLAEAGDILLQSGRVYQYGNSVMLEGASTQHHRLTELMIEDSYQSGTECRLANLFRCEVPQNEKVEQFAPPKDLCQTLLHDESFRDRLPRIHCYSPRPVFSEDFQFCRPGWHPESGLLIHGPEVEPRLPTTDTSSFLERFPRLTRVLEGFCFKSEADRTNTIGVLLTGLLTPHFLREPRPLVLVDGNQPGVGKTYLIQVMGLLFDGSVPGVIPFTENDEKLGNQILATLREDNSSVLLIDNAKVGRGGEINSTVIEANSTALSFSMRVLHTSQNYTTPNHYFWCLTMNGTKTTKDLLTRSVPLRLYHEGSSGNRTFPVQDLLAYVREHRAEILGELAGMILYWDQQGRDLITPEHQHRCQHWARLVGSILRANGLTGFLSNLEEATTDFDSEQDKLIALVESAWSGDRGLFHEVGGDESESRKASELVPLFSRSGVLLEELEAARSGQARATKVGRFLGPHLDQPVPVELDGRSARVRLRMRTLSGTKRYWFELEWLGAPELDIPAESMPEAAEFTPTALQPEAAGEAGAAASASPVSLESSAGSGNDEDWS